MLRRVVVRALIVGLAVLAGGLFMVDWDDLLLLSPVQRTDDAYLRGDPTTLSARVPGYVRRVAVTDMETVKAGQVLYEIDDDEYRAQVDLARAQVAEAGAQVAIANGADRASGAPDRRHAEQRRPGAIGPDPGRTGGVVGRTGCAARPPFCCAPGSRRPRTPSRCRPRWQATAPPSRRRRRSSRSCTRRSSRRRRTQQAKQAALETAQINLGYTRVLAPRDGRLGFRIALVGQYVAAGAPLIQLVPRNDVWVVANFRETQVRNMHVGQPARLTFDAYPGITLAGHIDSIEPGSEALGSLLPPDRAVGNFTKIAQRVPVKIRIDAGQARQNELIGRLFPGLSVEAAVDTSAKPTTPPTVPAAQSAPASPP